MGAAERFGARDVYDWLPTEAWRSLAFKVYPRAAFPDVGDAPPDLIGFALSADLRQMSDEELVTRVRDEQRTAQVGQVRLADGTPCDRIGIFRAGLEDVVAAVFRDAAGRPVTVKGRPIGATLN